MSLINDYMKKNVDKLKRMVEGNLAKMQELEAQSQTMQTDYNNLNATNVYLHGLIAEIEQLPQEVKENGKEDNSPSA